MLQVLSVLMIVQLIITLMFLTRFVDQIALMIRLKMLFMMELTMLACLVMIKLQTVLDASGSVTSDGISQLSNAKIALTHLYPIIHSIIQLIIDIDVSILTVKSLMNHQSVQSVNQDTTLLGTLENAFLVVL